MIGKESKTKFSTESSLEESTLKLLKKNGTIKEDNESFHVKQIGENVVSIKYSGEIIGFYEFGENGTLTNSINLDAIREDKTNFNIASMLAGYIETQEGNKDMYKIERVKLQDGILKGELVGDPLQKDSLEYFQAWKDIVFYEIRLWITTILQFDKSMLQNGDPKKFLTLAAKSGALRLYDLQEFKKQGLIDEKLLSEIALLFNGVHNNLLLNQIADSRFDKIDEGFSPEEIQEYIEKEYISPQLGNLAIKMIQIVEKLNEQKEIESKGIMKSEIKELEKNINKE
ncbi:MAG: hypothetical protein V3575_05820 [Candidatus Absconditabacteria bacterium]